MKSMAVGAVAMAALLAAPVAADTIELTGVVRDFKRGDWSGGHPDFETATKMGGFGHVKNMVTMNLSEDHKPVYNPNRPYKETVSSEASFNQWYRDVPEVNAAMPLTLTLDNGQEGPGGVYTYQNNAFWPIDGQMFGNQNLSKNFHFTFELHTEFTYSPGQVFTFIGDDDVWVYINGVRVIDLGGVHSAITGSVLLFDGKVFVEKYHFSKGGMVQEVSSSYATQLKNKWTALGLDGNCPVVEGARYIDLSLLEGQADTRVEFKGTSITAYAVQDLSNVVIKFEDGTQQKFDNLSTGTSSNFAGSDENQGKTIVGAWVKAGNNASGDGPGMGQYHAVDGSTSTECTLDFFFAERHTTQSNFRIDTTISLTTVPPTNISPLYD